jgi:peptidoglycan/xylan/chitin deacetylase (PgdA/CDA1 family)
MSGLIDSSLIRPVRKRFVIMKAHRHSNAVALTFDDGPDPELTPRLLALLKEENVPATFFLVGIRIGKSPRLVRQMAADGHETGVHTFSHRKMAELGHAAYVEEIEQTATLIEELTQHRPLLFRPPFGERNMQLLRLMIERRMRCILWSIDLRDYECKDKDVLLRKHYGTLLTSGDILLFHDSKKVTIEAMRTIIRDIRSRGLSFATVSRLLDKSFSGQTKTAAPGTIPGGQHTGTANAGTCS